MLLVQEEMDIHRASTVHICLAEWYRPTVYGSIGLWRQHSSSIAHQPADVGYTVVRDAALPII